MTDHQTGVFSASQQIAVTQSCTSCLTLDFTGDKNDVMTNVWPTADGEFHLNQVDSFRFRSSLVEIVEELKLRRKNEIENEERTQILIKEKYELERKIDLDANRMKNLQEENDKKLIETKRKFDEKMRGLEEKARQDSVQKESMEKEMEAMKDELQKLQLSKYSLEKLLREKERKIQIQSDSTEQHLQQLSGVEHKLQAFSTYCSKLVDSQEHLDRQVKEAIKLNQTLKYVNEHQKCLIGRNQEIIASLEVRLLEANKRVQDKSLVSSESQLKLDVAQLTQQLEGRKIEVEKLEREVEEQKSRCNETLEKLQDSYLLIERHLANAASHRDEAGILRTDKEELEGKYEALKVALDSTHRELDMQISLYQQAVDEWGTKSTETSQEMEKLRIDLDLSSKNCEQLEELNSNWAKHNLELSTSLQEAKTKLDVQKFDTDVQTTVSLFEVKDLSCQTSVDMVTVPSQTDSPIIHLAQTQTYSPAVTTNYTQTVHMPHQVACTQTRVAAVANTGTMATSDTADRGVQTLPVRVYSDFSDKPNDVKKYTKDNSKVIVDQSKIRNDPHYKQQIPTTKSDCYENTNVNKCSQVDDQEPIEPNLPRYQIDSKLIIGNMEKTIDEDVSSDRQDVTFTDEREISSVDFPATFIKDITEKEQIASVDADVDLNESHSEKVFKNPLLSSRISKSPTECQDTVRLFDVSQVSLSIKHRPQNSVSEQRMQGTFLQESPTKAVLDPSLAEKITSSYEEIVEMTSPKKIMNPALLSHSSSKTNEISEVIEDQVTKDRPRNSSLISSYRELGQNTIDVEKSSPRNSEMSLSLRKPGTQTKIQSKDDMDPAEEKCTSLKHAKKPCKTTGKFTLSSEKPGLLFEGKALFKAYMSSRSSSGDLTKHTSPQQKRRTSLRSTVDRRSTRQNSVSDTRGVRYNDITETRAKSGRTDTKQTRSQYKEMWNSEAVKSRQTSLSNTRYLGLIESSGNETTGQKEKSSPYSRYSAMFRSRLLQNESVKTCKNPTQEEKVCDERIEPDQTDPEKSGVSIRGILKGFNEKNVNVKSVHFIEGPPETQMIKGYPGDQSLFSDGEEDFITEGTSQFVSLEDFQSGTDTSEPKRRKLE